MTPGHSGVALSPTGSVTFTRTIRAGSLSIGYSRIIEVADFATHESSSINPALELWSKAPKVSLERQTGQEHLSDQPRSPWHRRSSAEAAC